MVGWRQGKAMQQLFLCNMVLWLGQPSAGTFLAREMPFLHFLEETVKGAVESRVLWGQSCTKGLARDPARSCCNGSIDPWRAPGFLTVAVSRVLL